MRYILLTISFLFLTNLYAIKYEELAGEDYTLKVGLDNDSKVSSSKDKKIIAPKLQEKPIKTIDDNIDLKEAYILYHIQNSNKADDIVGEVVNKNLLSIPQQLTTELKQNELTKTANTSTNNISENIAKLFLLRCETDKDYKVNSSININLYCKDLTSKDSIMYKLRANVSVDKQNKVSLKASPYMLEDDLGRTLSIVQEKSKIYNTISGDENIATYVDKRAIESITKSMATTAATDGPKLSQEYLDKKNAAQSTVIQTDTTTTTATNTPKPDASDYGISFLLSVISSGLKAGVDQLYMDLGYIYFIPKGSVIDAELFVKVN